MTFPALDLVALSTRINGGVAPNPLGYSGGTTDVGVSPAESPAEAGVDFRTNGTVGWAPTGYTGDTSWISGVFDPADFEISATMISGTTTPSGTIPFGSFAPLSSARFLSLLAFTAFEQTATFDVTVREIATPANSTTGQVILKASIVF